jgi:hypothetical protein
MIHPVQVATMTEMFESNRYDPPLTLQSSRRKIKEMDFAIIQGLDGVPMSRTQWTSTVPLH